MAKRTRPTRKTLGTIKPTLVPVTPRTVALAKLLARITTEYVPQLPQAS